MISRTKFRHLCTGLLPILLGVLAVGGLLLGAQPASAQGTCIQDVWQAHGNKQNLTCTANDVTLSSATNINITAGGSCATGVCQCNENQQVTFTADFEMDLTADTRYDIGFYIATDGDPNGDGAITGQCTATASLAGNTQQATFFNLDASPDVCGDITGPFGTAHNPVFVRAEIITTCTAGPSGKLELPFCTTWRQPGSNEECLGTGNGTTTNDVYPGSPSKCNCGTLLLDIFVEPSTGTISKTVKKSTITYEVEVKNTTTTHEFTLSQLCDTVFGTLAGSPACPAGTKTPTNNTCGGSAGSLPAQIVAGASYKCQFDGEASIDGSAFTDTVSATVVNEDGDPVDVGTDTASVTCSVP